MYKKLTKLTLLLSFFVIAGGLYSLLNFHFKLINYPYQLDAREGAPFLIATEMLRGNFPYVLSNLPYLTDVFGVLYYLFGIPFLKVFGIHLSSMRILSAVCIFIVIILFYLILRKNKINVRTSLFFTLIFYSLNLFTIIPIVRPDSLGFLLFILSLYIPVWYSFSRKSLLLSLFFCLLAYLTKSYFAISFPFIVLFLFFFHSKIRAVKYAILFFLALISFQIILYLFFDFNLIGTLSAQLSSKVNNFSHLVFQLNFYFITLLLIPSVLLIFVIIRYIVLKRNLLVRWIENPKLFLTGLDFKNKDQPLFRFQLLPDVHWFYFILGLFLIVFKLGGHTGQFGVYLIHFLSFPFLVIIAKKLNSTITTFPLLLFIVLVLILTRVLNIHKLDRVIKPTTEFNHIVHEIKKSKTVLATPILASVLVEQHKYVYASGLTEYFFYVPLLKNNYVLPNIIAKVKDKILLPTIVQSELQIATYLVDIQKKVIAKKIDVIYLDNTIYDDWMVDPKLVKKYYKIVDTTNVVLYASFQEYKIFKLVPRN